MKSRTVTDDNETLSIIRETESIWFTVAWSLYFGNCELRSTENTFLSKIVKIQMRLKNVKEIFSDD